MSTFEDFEKAPAGATAYREDVGLAMKVGELFKSWVIPDGSFLTSVQMEIWGFTLMSAREALDLAWELAYPVREGQKIPAGTLYLQRTKVPRGVVEALLPFTVWGEAAPIRTLEPLPDPEPDPEPDWLDAPAVLAVCNDIMARAVFVRRGNDQWRSEFYDVGTADLRDVTPLYPKETK